MKYRNQISRRQNEERKKERGFFKLCIYFYSCESSNQNYTCLYNKGAKHSIHWKDEPASFTLYTHFTVAQSSYIKCRLQLPPPVNIQFSPPKAN